MFSLTQRNERKKKQMNKPRFTNVFLRLTAVQIKLKEKYWNKFVSSDEWKSNIWNMFFQVFPRCFAQAAFYWAFPESEEQLGDS